MVDVDGDGDDAIAVGGNDCDDDDPAIHGGAPETWDDDGVDNDCDGESREPITWTADGATWRLDGSEPGGELGRDLAVWGEGGQLLATAPFADSSRGMVYVENLEVPGVRDVGTGPVLVSDDDYAFLAAPADARDDGVAFVAETGWSAGRGRIHAIDLSDLPPGSTSVATAARWTVESQSDEGWFGSDVRWLGDVDGDGLEDALVSAPYQDVAADADGALYVFLSPSLDDTIAQSSDANVILSGGRAGAVAESATVARYTLSGETWLAVGLTSTSEGDPIVLRIPASALISGPAIDISDGALLADAAGCSGVPSLLGNLTDDGQPWLAVHCAHWELWSTLDIEGAVSAGVSPARVIDSADTDYPTVVSGPGDLDGDGSDDLAVTQDDGFLGTSAGSVAFVPGAPAIAFTATDADAARLTASGDEILDAFGYRVVGVHPPDGASPLAAVAAYSTDYDGASTGSIYFVPMP